MTAKHAPGSFTVAPTIGGYCIYREDNWPIAIVVQRDAHPLKGGGITDSEARANAWLFTMSPDLLALAHKYASECAGCGGERNHDDGEWMPCEECADIWHVIDLAEGRT